MLTHAVKYLNPQRRSKYVLQLSDVALTNAYGTLVNKPHELNRIGKLYDSEVLKTVSDAVGHEPSASGKGHWVHIPRIEKYEKAEENEIPLSFTQKQYAGDRDYTNEYFIKDGKYFVSMDGQLFIDGFSRPEEISKEKYIEQSKKVNGMFSKGSIKGKESEQHKVNVELLRKLSPSTWCTAGGMASHYVENYDNYLLIVDGVTVAGIEAGNKGPNGKNQVKEVTSRGNNGIASVDHIDDIIAFFDKHNLDTDNNTLKRALKAKNEGKQDSDIFTDKYEYDPEDDGLYYGFDPHPDDFEPDFLVFFVAFDPDFLDFFVAFDPLFLVFFDDPNYPFFHILLDYCKTNNY
jgi:hypothetical protein